jgi:hypothetical protein
VKACLHSLPYDIPFKLGKRSKDVKDQFPPDVVVSMFSQWSAYIKTVSKLAGIVKL